MDRSGTIYCWHNTLNNKRYIGKTTSLNDRTVAHIRSVKKGSLYALHCAIRKYGLQIFNVYALHKDVPESALSNLEIECIKAYGSLAPFGYNMTEGGDGGVPSEEVRIKIGDAQRGIPKPPDQVAKNSGDKHYFYGKKHSDETRSKISAALEGENHPLYGKKHSEETKAKIRENHADISGENHPNFGKFGKDHPSFGKKRSPETCARISEGKKKGYKERKESMGKHQK